MTRKYNKNRKLKTRKYKKKVGGNNNNVAQTGSAPIGTVPTETAAQTGSVKTPGSAPTVKTPAEQLVTQNNNEENLYGLESSQFNENYTNEKNVEVVELKLDELNKKWNDIQNINQDTKKGALKILEMSPNEEYNEQKVNNEYHSLIFKYNPNNLTDVIKKSLANLISDKINGARDYLLKLLNELKLVKDSKKSFSFRDGLEYAANKTIVAPAKAALYLANKTIVPPAKAALYLGDKTIVAPAKAAFSDSASAANWAGKQALTTMRNGITTPAAANSLNSRNVQGLSDNIKNFVERTLQQLLVNHLGNSNVKYIIAKAINDERVHRKIKDSFLKSTKITLEEVVRSSIFRMEDLETKNTFWNFFNKQPTIKALLSQFVLHIYNDHEQITLFFKLVNFLKNKNVVVGGQNSENQVINTQARILAFLYKQMNEIIMKKADPVIEKALRDSVTENFTQLMNTTLKKYLLETSIFKDDKMVEIFFKSFILSIDDPRYNADNVYMQDKISGDLLELQSQVMSQVKGGCWKTTMKSRKKKSKLSSRRRKKKT